MILRQFRQRRLTNQLLTSPVEDPARVIARLGAVQAQDYLGALWAVGQRTRSVTEGEVEQALADRRIVRTWPMRGTLHIVAAADVRWMLELCTPRIVKRLALRHAREYGLDEAAFARGREVLIRALEGGKSLTRPAVYQILETAGITVAGQAGVHLLWRLSQEGLICFGARAGKQQTFVLLDEWVPGGRKFSRDEALAELAGRYFTGHGPATLADFVWWSGLPVADARAGLRMVENQFERAVIDGETFWLSSEPARRKSRTPIAHLLPPFDEYLVGYKDRNAVLDPRFAGRLSALLSPAVELEGQVVGTWGRRLIKGGVELAFRPFGRLDPTQSNAVDRAAQRYAAFLGREIMAG